MAREAAGRVLRAHGTDSFSPAPCRAAPPCTLAAWRRAAQHLQGAKQVGRGACAGTAWPLRVARACPRARLQGPPAGQRSPVRLGMMQGMQRQGRQGRLEPRPPPAGGREAQRIELQPSTPHHSRASAQAAGGVTMPLDHWMQLTESNLGGGCGGGRAALRHVSAAAIRQRPAGCGTVQGAACFAPAPALLPAPPQHRQPWHRQPRSRLQALLRSSSSRMSSPASTVRCRGCCGAAAALPLPRRCPAAARAPGGCSTGCRRRHGCSPLLLRCLLQSGRRGAEGAAG